MKKLFVDVGGNEIDTSLVALGSAFGFAKVFCFEPVGKCAEHIKCRIFDNISRVIFLKCRPFSCVHASLITKAKKLQKYRSFYSVWIDSCDR